MECFAEKELVLRIRLRKLSLVLEPESLIVEFLRLGLG
jgi:hypothetical protein